MSPEQLVEEAKKYPYRLKALERAAGFLWRKAGFLFRDFQLFFDRIHALEVREQQTAFSPFLRWYGTNEVHHVFSPVRDPGRRAGILPGADL